MQPGKVRAAAVPVSQLPGALPSVNIPEDTDHAEVVKTALKGLNLGLKAGSLAEGAQWRDVFALTGTMRTFFPVKRIEAAWRERSRVHEPINFCAVPGASRIMRRGPKIAWIQGAYTFETCGSPSAKCSGVIGLVPDEETSSWKIWVLTTVLEQLHGLKNVDVLEPEIAPSITEQNGTDASVSRNQPISNGHGVNGHAQTNGHADANGHADTKGDAKVNGDAGVNGHASTNGDGTTNSRTLFDGHSMTNGHGGTNGHSEPTGLVELQAPAKVNGDETGFTANLIDFDCVVCGGGQAGLVVAGRLKAGGVTNVIALDRNEVIGGNWLTRYDSVKC